MQYCEIFNDFSLEKSCKHSNYCVIPRHPTCFSCITVNFLPAVFEEFEDQVPGRTTSESAPKGLLKLFPETLFTWDNGK